MEGNRVGIRLGSDVEGVTVGALGAIVGLKLGTLVGTKLGCLVGLQLGQKVDSKVGLSDGLIMGLLVGDSVGDKVGLSEGLILGLLDGVLLERGLCPDEYLKVYREQMTMCSRYNNFILNTDKYEVQRPAVKLLRITVIVEQLKIQITYYVIWIFSCSTITVIITVLPKITKT